MLGDIRSVRLLYVKGVLFLVLGVVAGGMLIVEGRWWVRAVLWGVSVWGFCRAYYFAFYVVEKYADPGFRYSGIGAFLWYAWRKK